MNSILERFRMMPDKQLQEAKLEISNSYRSIQGTLAWKHMMEELEKIYAESFKAGDQMDIKDFSIAVSAEARGIRKGLDALRRKIDSATASPPTKGI